MYDGGVAIDTAIVQAMAGGLIVKDLSLDILAVHNAYNKKFFITYEPELPEDEKSRLVPFSKSLLDQMRDGFAGGADKMEVLVESEQVHLKVTGDHYQENLVEFEPPDMGKLVFVKKAKLGYVLKDFKSKVQVLVKAADLAGLPKAEHLLFTSDGTTLSVVAEWEGIGKRTKTVPFTDNKALEEFEISFDQSYFQKVAKQFTGDVWLSIGSDPNDLEVAVLSQAAKEYLTTYVVSAI